MKPHVPEAELNVTAFELRQPVGAQGERSMTTPDRVLPAMGKR